MRKVPPKPELNVVPMSAKSCESRNPGRDSPAHAHGSGVLAAAGSPDDPRIQEALRLIEAFLAIEDATARTALITLAERLVTFDWARKVQQR